MTEPLAVLIVRALTLSLACGVVFTAAALLRDVGKLDPGLQDASFVVRVLIAPGLVALWPVAAARRLMAQRTDLPGARPPRQDETTR